METTQSDTTTIDRRNLEKNAAKAAALQSVVIDRADRHDDEYLYLAAWALDRLNDDLNDLAYQ